MTLSEIRRRIDALKRRFAPELAIIRLHRYLDDTIRQGDVPEPECIVLNLLPWASKDRYRAFFRWDLPPAPTR